MNTKRYLILLLLAAGLTQSKISAQADYVLTDTAYTTLPNAIELKAYYANVEDAEGACANEGKHLRVRGLKDGGYAEFTVPNAENVTIAVKGKSTGTDRIVRIYRDGELADQYTLLDANNCATFSENIHRDAPVTYRITGGDDTSTKPIVITSIIVEKYAQTARLPSAAERQEQCRVYPNPIKETVTVELAEDARASFATIYSLTGAVVFEERLSGQTSFALAVAHLPKGMYVMRVVSDKGIWVKTIIKG